ncbi:MAG: hypothetical protein KDK25_14675 [Leptospiraceae bacterium]|nr:hypothetical protein [Leptospiraceae bacterium]
MSSFDFEQAFSGLFRESYGRIASVLAKEFRDLELAEDALQEALIVAAAKWPRSGLPDNAAGWLYVVARRKAIDSLRRTARQNKRAIASSGDTVPAAPEASISTATGMMGMYGASEVPDERLSLIFACCHPAINETARVALTLQTLSALSTADIAAALLTKEAALAQRIVRAKRKIKSAGIPFAIPDLEQWPERIHTVLFVIYLIFNAGYTARSGEALLKTDLCDEAVYLSGMLVDLLPGNSEAMSLLALLLFQDSRRAARMDANGSPVLLGDQDRSKWDKEKIQKGMQHLCAARQAGSGLYLHQAEIAALHATSATPEETQWAKILDHYDRLLEIHPSPVVHLNRTVALKMAMDAATALSALDDAGLASALSDYRYYHSTRGEFLLELGRAQEAEKAFCRALGLSENEQERKHLRSRLQAAAGQAGP